MVRNGDVLMSQLARRFSHFLNRAFAVASRGVHVQIALDVLAAHQIGQTMLLGSFDFTGILANFGRDKIQFELAVDLFFRARQRDARLSAWPTRTRSAYSPYRS